MKKRIISLLVPVVMAASVLAGCTPGGTTTTTAGTTPTGTTTAGDTSGGGTTTADGVTEPGVTLPERPDIIENVGDNTLIIGTTTEPTGDFATPYWQNNATDNDVNGFLSGYSTYELTREGEFVLNDTAVEKLDVTENASGTKTYTYTIADGLVYSDGTPITAKDYVTSILLFSSPILSELQAKPIYGQFFVGYSDYMQGEATEFTGVRLIDEMTFSVELDAEYVPSFFEVANVTVGPTPLGFWLNNEAAGEVDVLDDGNGAYFSDNFTKDNFEDSILEAKNNPERPVSGPYGVKQWDAASRMMVLEINDKFVGNYEGQKPSIQTVIIRHITQATAIDELRTGGVDLLTSMMDGTEVNAGFDLVEDGTDSYNYYDYARAGYGKLAFVADIYPTKDVEVRQAIAHLLNRDNFTQAFTGGFGTVVDGPYGEGQWFWKEAQAELQPRLDRYSYDPDKAMELLDSAGWNLNEDGSAYGGTGLRYKEDPDTGETIPLIIKWASSEGNAVSELLVTQLQQNPDVTAAGMQIDQTTMTFQELLNYLYRDGSQGDKYATPTYNMFNLASNFPAAYTAKDEYTTDPDKLAAGFNTNFIIDEELYELAESYWKVEPGDNAAFVDGWSDFVVRWNELLPDLPLYSNQIHDFYGSKLQNYETSAVAVMADVILYATVVDK